MMDLSKLSPEQLEILSAQIRKRAAAPDDRIPAVRTDGPLPLSFAQQRLWFVDRLVPGSPFYNIPLALRLQGPLNVAALERALAEIHRRHEALRTSFLEFDGHPVQVIAPTVNFSLRVVDLSDLPEEGRFADMLERCTLETKRPFDLTQCPLIRANLFVLADQEAVLLLVMHHIISDGWSIGILTKELAVLYEAYTHDKPSPLTELPIQYADFACWQKQRLQGERLEKSLAYWRRQLANLPAPLPLTDRTRPTVPQFNGSRRPIRIPKPVCEQLERIGRQERATTFMTLLAAFKALLFRYTGQLDVVVGTPIANRNRGETEQLIGFFVNSLVLRTDLSGEPSFRDLLKRVREVTMGAYTHQDLPFERLVEEIKPERDLSHNPLFQIIFALQSEPLPAMEVQGLAIEIVEIAGQVSLFDLTVSLWTKAQGVLGSIDYNSDLFDEATIDRLILLYNRLLEGLVINPDMPITRVPLLNEAERHQIIVEWNRTESEFPRQQSIHQLFEAQVRHCLDAIAIIEQDKRITYGELNERANQLAHYLGELGVGPEARVGVCLPRGEALIVSLLAILKAGGAYVPLDPSYPPERLAFMMEDAELVVVITLEAALEVLPDYAGALVQLDRDGDLIAAMPVTEPGVELDGDNLAYINYTSGSTGIPKGIAIPHRAVIRLVCNTNYVQLGPDDRLALASNTSFDAVTFEIWGALLNGAALVVFTAEQMLSPTAFAQDLAEQRVSTLFLTTALFNQVARQAPAAFSQVKQLLFGGETVEPRWVREVMAAGGPQRLLHVYGPTETTTFATWQEVGQVPMGETVAIGRGLSNTTVYVLDEGMEVVPVGVVGEVYIGGAGLGRGYQGQAELTAERFVANPYSAAGGERLYRTGDLAKYRRGGELEYVGRRDGQVKMRGYRVEMGEIEAKLKEHEGVREAVVVMREGGGEKRLVGYVVKEEGEEVSGGELRRYLRGKLPEYMVPGMYVEMERMPLTPNGKVDHKALPSPAGPSLEQQEAYVAPQTEIERTIAAVWQEVLQIEQAGLNDNFFDLGGHSLLMAQVQSRLNQAIGRNLSMVELFNYPTISALAKFLSQGANEPAYFEAVQSRTEARKTSQAQADLSIAIIGLSGRFPGARTVDEFWQNLRDGVESIASFNDSELQSAGIDVSLYSLPNYVRARGVLEDIEQFDADFFGFTPREAELMDPQQRLFLECAWEALENAGYDPGAYAGEIGVYAGAAMSSYLLNLYSNRDFIATVGDFQIMLGNDKDHLATQVSYRLNLKGPSLAVQTACSTSLVAVHLASQALLSGQCDMALAGGVSIGLPQKAGYLYHRSQILSPDGRCRAFDADAQGCVSGNGAGIVVLKRLADALADGDTVYAVIKGSAINNDGSSKVGYTAPSIDGQAAVIAEALSMAGASPDTINYVETHGTATPLGDPIEVAALNRVFRTGNEATGACALGSVKTNIGHLNAAAGVASLIKTVLALKHKQLPPSLNFKRSNPDIDFANSPFYVNTRLSQWKANGKPRRAGVSSFGIGGTNAHIVVEEAPALTRSAASAASQLLVLSAKTRAALEHATDRLAAFLAQSPDVELADVAYTLQVGRRRFKHRRVIVCRDREDALHAFNRRPVQQVFDAESQANECPVVFMFSGTTDQPLVLARGLYATAPASREAVDSCCEILNPLFGFDWREGFGLLDQGATQPPPTARIELSEIAAFVSDYAVAKLWMAWGVQPETMIGYGVGEYVAACLAGVLSLADALRLLAKRAEWMQKQPAAIDAFADLIQRINLQAPRIPYVSSLTGKRITAFEATDPQYWVKQSGATVRVAEGIDELCKEPARIFLEVGAGQRLTSLVRQNRAVADSSRPRVFASASGATDQLTEIDDLLRTLGQLWSAGVNVAWPAFHAGERRRRIALPAYPFERQRYWVERQGSSGPSADRSVSAPLVKQTEIAKWFYVPSWKRSPVRPHLERKPSSNQCRNWLIFADDHGLSRRLEDRLRARGDSVITVRQGAGFKREGIDHYTIACGRRDDYISLLRELRSRQQLPQRIVHLWNVTADDPAAAMSGVELPEPDYDASFFSLILLAQTLRAQNVTESIHIGIVSTNLQKVTGGERLCPQKATLLGPCKVIPQEYANLTCSSIDISFADLAGRFADRLADNLIAELATETPEPVVAYRRNDRWQQILEPVSLTEAAEENIKLREGGTYLITGGLGGIGLALATYLAETVRARLILVGRSDFPASESWQGYLEAHSDQDAVSRKIRKLQALEQLGATVLVARADVADADQMRAVRDQARARFGQIHGIIHCAGVAGGGVIQLKNRDSAASVMAPKVSGTLVLANLFSDVKLDFFVLCSSFASFYGGVGIVDYSSANAFLNAFADYYTATTDTLTVAIGWDTWQEVGMSVDLVLPADLEASRQESLSSGILPSEGVKVFCRALGAELSQVIVSTTELTTRLQQLAALTRSAPEKPFPIPDAATSAGPRPPLPNLAVPPRNDLERTLVSIWQSVLGIEPVGVFDNFFELGGHSLLATQVLSRVAEALHVDLYLDDLFAEPTVDGLASAIQKALQETGESRPDPLERIDRSVAPALAESLGQLSDDYVNSLIAMLSDERKGDIENV